MSLVQRFAQVFGAIYLLVGIMGFIPPLLTGKRLTAPSWGCYSACSTLIGYTV